MPSPHITTLPVYHYRTDWYHATSTFNDRHYYAFETTRHAAMMAVARELAVAGAFRF